MPGTDRNATEPQPIRARRVKVGRSIRVDGITVTVEAIEGNEVRLRIDDAKVIKVLPR